MSSGRSRPSETKQGGNSVGGRPWRAFPVRGRWILTSIDRLTDGADDRTIQGSYPYTVWTTGPRECSQTPPPRTVTGKHHDGNPDRTPPPLSSHFGTRGWGRRSVTPSDHPLEGRLFYWGPGLTGIISSLSPPGRSHPSTGPLCHTGPLRCLDRNGNDPESGEGHPTPTSRKTW